jgi:hypothetical protein
MMTLTSCGGFLPIEMASMRMEGSVVAGAVASDWLDSQARQQRQAAARWMPGVSIA